MIYFTVKRDGRWQVLRSHVNGEDLIVTCDSKAQAELVIDTLNKPPEIEHIKISRDQIVEQLTRSMFDDIEMNMEKLDDMIMYGFKGYENYDIEDLVAEYKEYINEEFPENVTIELEE